MKQTLLLIITLLFPLIVNANTTENKECGINENRNVAAFNTEVCDEDRFSKISNTLIQFDTQQEEEKDYITIAKSKIDDSLYFATVVILLIVGITFLFSFLILMPSYFSHRSLKPLLIWVVALAVTIIIYSPVKVGKHALTTYAAQEITKLSNKSAIYFTSAYLSLFSSGSIEDRIKEEGRDNLTYHQSQAYALNLVKSRLCNEVTRQNVFNRSLGDFADPETLRNNAECAFGNKEGFNLTNITDVNVEGSQLTDNVAYQQITVAPSTNNRKYRFMSSGVAFGMESPLDGYCSKFGSFNCSTIKISKPVITGEETKKLAEDVQFEDTLFKVIKQITVDSNNKNAIASGFKNIIDEAKKLNDGAINESNKNKLEALNLVYHQTIENYLLSGYVDIISQDKSRYISNKTEISTIKRLIEMASLVSTSASNYQCALYPSENFKAKKTARTFNSVFNGNEEYINNPSTYCLQYQNKQFHAYGEFFDLSEEEEKNKLFEYVKNQEKDAITYFNNLVDVIYEQKIAIKLSYLESLKQIQPNDFWKQVRQEGLLGLGHYLLKIQVVSNTSSKLTSFFDAEHFVVTQNYNDSNYLSLNKTNDENTLSLGYYNLGYDVADKLSDLVSKQALENLNTDTNYNVQEVISLTDNTTKHKSGMVGDILSTNIVRTYLDLIRNFTISQGYKKNFFGDNKKIDECIKSENCVRDSVTTSYILNEIQFGNQLLEANLNTLSAIGALAAFAESGIDSKGTGRISGEIVGFFQSTGAIIIQFLIISTIAAFIYAFWIAVFFYVKFISQILKYFAFFYVFCLYSLMYPALLLFPQTRGKATYTLISTTLQLLLRPVVIVIAFIFGFLAMELLFMLKNEALVFIYNSGLFSSDILAMFTMLLNILFAAIIAIMLIKVGMGAIDFFIENILKSINAGNIKDSTLANKIEGGLTSIGNKFMK